MASTQKRHGRWIHDDFELEAAELWDRTTRMLDTLRLERTRREERTLVEIVRVRTRTSWTRGDDSQLRDFVGELAAKILPYDPITADCHVGSLYFRLLREWLRDCDDSHDECKLRQSETKFWPTRVICVGDSNNLILVEKELSGEDYVVLSHCWGTPTDLEKEQVCTTRKNYQDRLRDFSYNDLPKTFQDAVRVTRELGKQYLWIDALCIIQGPDGDWESEARTMEDIFACAYCTIAASSAGGWGDGFLKPNPSSQYTDMQDIAGKQTCDCDFDKDVDEGSLMKRAWVLQERVLSRRVIHFAATHTYWECGDGVRCEQFTRLEPPFGKQYFILDTAFPKRLSKAGYSRSLDFVRFLFERYSQSGLTVKSDRDTAILSLVNRMERVFDTKASCGIIRCFLSSLLLWKRTDREITPPIDYEDKERTPPSWSWMAYSGGIDFISDDQKELKIPHSADLDLSDDGKALNVKVRRFENCRMEEEGAEHAIFGAAGQVGSLWFDLAGRHEFGHCVVVGMTNDWSKQDHEKTYYVLMVREKQDRGEYERVGVGKVEAVYVSTGCEDGKLL